MADITIRVTDDECRNCIKAISAINVIPHVKHMSIAMIAETAAIKATKCRAVLDELVQRGYAERYATTTNPKIQRYYYVITPEGLTFASENKYGDEAKTV